MHTLIRISSLVSRRVLKVVRDSGALGRMLGNSEAAFAHAQLCFASRQVMPLPVP
jgi:hypothetical protein